jgi:uncharacterized protein
MKARESRYNIWTERGSRMFVYNGVSGGLLAMSKSDYDDLRAVLGGDDEARFSEELLGKMLGGRMLVSEDFDELDFLATRYAFSRYNRQVFGLTLVPSLGCNFDCPYCFEDKHPSVMDDDVQASLLAVVDDQIGRGITGLRVTWYGGEPLVGRRPLFAMSESLIERCDRAGVRYSAHIVTNGYLLDEATCARLREYRVAHAQVTLDGPPDVHNRMRPLVSGGGTFDKIVRNLHHAVDYLSITVRVNVDAGNVGRVEELLQLLAEAGLAHKLSVTPGHLVGTAVNPQAPSATYGIGHRCLTNAEFARVEREFAAMAERYGFGSPSLPMPKGAPCTAVRANELVVGSRGELYKCWDSVGDPAEVIGHIRDYQDTNGRMHKWLKYDPFSNAECRGCIALPVCMGGCAAHAFESAQYENRCGSFRHTYREQVDAAVDSADASA